MYFEDSVVRHDFRPLNSGRGGRRVGAGRKPLPEELKRQRRAMRKQITISWNLCHDWESKKAKVGIKRDREFLQYLMQQCSRSNNSNGNLSDCPLGTMADYVAYINDLRLEDKLCDVTFVIKEGDTSYVNAHKIVLMMTSRYFRSLSRVELASRNEFYLQDITMKGIQLLLDFMYGRVIDPVEHYKNLQQTTQAASLLQVDVYLQNARAIARRGRKLMEANEMTSSQLSEPGSTNGGHPYYVVMPNGQPGLMVPFRAQVVQSKDDLNTVSPSDVDIRTEYDEGSSVPNTIAAAALTSPNVPITGDYECIFCHKSFRRHVLLQRHKRLMHTFRFTTWLYQRRKILAYSFPVDKAENKCKFCRNSFANMNDLRKHKATVHRYIRVPKSRKERSESFDESTRHILCSICSASFDTKRLLKKHVLKTHRQKCQRLACSKCPRKFALPQSLYNHMIYPHSAAGPPPNHLHNHGDNFASTKPMRSVETRVFDSIAALREMAKPAPAVQTPAKESSKPQMKCHICSLTYNHRSLLMKHIQIVHQDVEQPKLQELRETHPPPRNTDPPPPPPLMRAPIIADSEKQAWRCHICELPFGFHWSLIRHLELVHRIVGTHLDVARAAKNSQSPDESLYPPRHDYRRFKAKTVRQLIEQSQDRQTRTDDGSTIKEILERKIRRREIREDRSLQHLEDRFGSTSMVPNTRFGDMLQLDAVGTYERASPTVDYGIASPQQLTAMVQAPLLPFSTSPQNKEIGLDSECDNDIFSVPQTPKNRNARRRHRLTGQHEPVPQPPKEHERILSTRVNIQRPAYSQMTFKLVKSKKDPKGESELKLWPQHREIYDCSGCGQAFSRYPSYAKHVVKCVGELPEMPLSVTGSLKVNCDRKKSAKPKSNPIRHYDFKEYCPPENKFRYQYSV